MKVIEIIILYCYNIRLIKLLIQYIIIIIITDSGEFFSDRKRDAQQ